MKRIVILLALGMLVSVPVASGQAWLNSMGKRVINRAEEKAKEKAEERINQKVDEATDRALDSAEKAAQKGLDEANRGLDEADKALGEVNDQSEGDEQSMSAAERKRAEKAKAAGGNGAEGEPQTPKTQLETAYAKSDFVAGDEIFFEDLQEGEQVGEFPSCWDSKQGTLEIAKFNGKTVIVPASDDDPTIVPLFDDMFNYLPEEFTLEFDFWINSNTGKNGDEDSPSNNYNIQFCKPDTDDWCQQICIDSRYNVDEDALESMLAWDYEPPTGDDRSGRAADNAFSYVRGQWNHFALSFNKRAMKVYINGTRLMNIPNTVAPGNFSICFYRPGGCYINQSAITNVRLAKGAVPLYDRMMSDGKFITYGITFDVGKSVIKPESMGELSRIVKLMNDNPSLKFSVEGHTDSTGNAASNQTLSEARSKAIVAKLVEMGIAADRLSSAGKGQNSPIADNSTDEGRAKNRRVEFVKK